MLKAACKFLHELSVCFSCELLDVLKPIKDFSFPPPLVGAVFIPSHWISSLGFLSCAPMFRPLCLVSFPILNHLLHVEWSKSVVKWHECHATCNMRYEEDVLYQNYLYYQWNHQQISLWYQQVFLAWLDAEMLVLWPLQTCAKGVLYFPLPYQIFCPLQFLILHIKRLVICTIPFVMILAPQVLSHLGIPVNHRGRGVHNRNSTLLDVRPLGTKTVRNVELGKEEVGVHIVVIYHDWEEAF